MSLISIIVIKFKYDLSNAMVWSIFAPLNENFHLELVWHVCENCSSLNVCKIFSNFHWIHIFIKKNKPKNNIYRNSIDWKTSLLIFEKDNFF